MSSIDRVGWGGDVNINADVTPVGKERSRETFAPLQMAAVPSAALHYKRATPEGFDKYKMHPSQLILLSS